MLYRTQKDTENAQQSVPTIRDSRGVQDKIYLERFLFLLLDRFSFSLDADPFLNTLLRHVDILAVGATDNVV